MSDDGALSGAMLLSQQLEMAAPDPNKPDRGPERLIHTG